jgi:PAS domain S-box-containing protein
MDSQAFVSKLKNLPLIALAGTTIISISICVYCLSSGITIIFQNLFYFPIIIACVFFGKKGFAFSIALAWLYFIFVLIFSADISTTWQALIRVIIFMLVAAVISYLSSARENAVKKQIQTQALYKNVVDSATKVSIIATDKDGIITAFNSGAEQMLGYRGEEAIGTKTPAFIHLESEINERKKKYSRKFNREVGDFEVFTFQDDDVDHEWTYVKKDGNKIDVDLSVTPVKNEEKEIIGYLGIAIDVTRRNLAENQLKQKNNELAEINKNLERKNFELELYNKAAVERELRMIELKKEIKERD